MIKQAVLLFLAGSALTASASTITFQPNSQTINLGASTTVGVYVSGLSVGQAIGAFDVLVLDTSSILKPTGVVFFNNLGVATTELTGSTLTTSSVEAAEVSFETTATLLGLQGTQPFELFQLTYMGVGTGTSPLTLGVTPDILSDGSGTILPVPTVVPGSITVSGGVTPPVTPVPEPSTLALLGSGCGLVGWMRKRRQQM